jgi:hypothetical protein
MKKICDLITDQLIKIQYNDVNPISNNQVDMIFETMESIDPDIKPLTVILSSLIKNLEDNKVKTLYILHYLKYYGIGNDDILSTRHKYVIDSGKLVKIPFLKKEHKESINILLDTMDLKGTLDEKEF